MLVIDPTPEFCASPTLTMVHVEQLVMSYTQQDLVCDKCHRAAAGMLSPYCDCSGTFVMAVKRETVKDRMDAYRGVASFYGFAWLQEELDNYSLPPPVEA